METPTTLEVLAARHAAGSRPGARDDEHRVVLSIEGGGNRAAYSAGMVMALDALGLTEAFDAVYGTSAGALNAAWLLTGDAQEWLPSWAWPEVAAAGVTDPRRLLRGGPIVDLSVLVEHVYESITPMAFEAILEHPVTFHPMATDAATGESVDLAPYVRDRRTLQDALRATTCLPLLAGRPVRLGGRGWLDGGLSEPVPFATPVAQDATHLLVLRTRRTDQPHKGTSRVERMLMTPYFTRHARGAGRAHHARHVTQAEAERRMRAGVPDVLQVRPPEGSPDVGRLTKDLDLIAEAIEIGRRVFGDVVALQSPGD